MKSTDERVNIHAQRYKFEHDGKQYFVGTVRTLGDVQLVVLNEDHEKVTLPISTELAVAIRNEIFPDKILIDHTHLNENLSQWAICENVNRIDESTLEMNGRTYAYSDLGVNASKFPRDFFHATDIAPPVVDRSTQLKLEYFLRVEHIYTLFSDKFGNDKVNSVGKSDSEPSFDING